MDVSEYKYLTFGDMIDALKKYELVLTVDIKEIRSRYDKTVIVLPLVNMM